MADYTPVYANGARPYTMTTSATVTGGQVLIASGAGTVGPAGAGATVVIGVAAHDAASGARVSVWPLVNVEHEIVVVAAGTVTAGEGVETAAAGTVATAATSIATSAAAGKLIGIATSTATAPNAVRFVGRN